MHLYEKIDNDIIDRINQKIQIDKNYFSYKNIKYKKGIHSAARYPATMVPQMLNDIIDIIINSGSVESIYDPFMGSGTVIVESMRRGVAIYGNDINPLSYLIVKSKTTYIEEVKLKNSLNVLMKRINSDSDCKMHTFNNIEKWFNKDIIRELSRVRNSILRFQDKEVKLFFLIVLADIVTDTKNSRSSTFKLHIKNSDSIYNFRYNVIEKFYKKACCNIENHINFYNELIENGHIVDHTYCSDVSLTSYDSKENNGFGNIPKDSIDLVITSPPYGDNQTTVTYGQYSILPLLWITHQNVDSEIDIDLLENFSKIDSSSLGGRKYSIDYIENSLILDKSMRLNQLFKKLIKLKNHDKVRKVMSFFIDFEISLYNMLEVTKRNGYLVFVVGNRRVHNYEVKFDDVLKEFLADTCVEVTDFRRMISNKKIASRVSAVNEKSVKSMDSETILVFRKK